MNAIFESWLGRSTRIQIGVPVFQGTETTFQFQVLEGEATTRTPIDLTGYEVVFQAEEIESDSDTNTLKALFSPAKVCSITDAVNGLCEFDATDVEMDKSGKFNGELALKSAGAGQPIDDRVLFFFEIERNLV